MNTGNNGPAGQPASGPGETAEATTPTINWPAWLEEYYQADQADRIAGRLADVFGPENDPEIAKLKETERAALARLHDVVSRIQGAPADSQEALAVKMAVAWNYHGEFPLDQNNELTNELGGEILLLQTSLDALAVQTGLSLFEIYGRDGPSVYPDPTDEPDAGLLWLEREHRRLVHYAENAPRDRLSDEDRDASAARQAEISKKVAQTIAANPAGVAAKMRLLRDEYESLKAAWAEQGWETCLTSLEQMNGDVKVAVAVEPEAERSAAQAGAAGHNDPADAKLFALEAELKEAHKGLSASVAVVGNTDEDHQPWYDRIMAADQAAEATPAQTAAGVLAKLRMAIYYEAKVAEGTDGTGDDLMRSAVKDAERIGATVPVDPDAELQSLWREYQQNNEAWDKTEENTPENKRCHEESTAIAQRIIAAKAEGLHGIAVKLLIAANVPFEDRTLAGTESQDEQAVISAYDDAVRLTGIGGAL